MIDVILPGQFRAVADNDHAAFAVFEQASEHGAGALDELRRGPEIIRHAMGAVNIQMQDRCPYGTVPL